jgi:tetratricopeptide (TPR) repeat protein
MLPELAAEAPHPEAGDPKQLRFRLFDAVARLLRESASAKPILLVLDDLHEADVASLQLLKFVARMARDAKLIIVGTYRDAEMRHSAERAAIIPDILRDATQLPLAGLVEDEVGRMVELRARRTPDPDFVAALSRTTAGNPLFVDGIIRVLAAEGRFGSAQPTALEGYKLPEVVRAAIQRWLGLLSPEARTLLTSAALIGLEFEPGLVGEATATAPEQVAELLSSAQKVGIASSVGKSLCRFAHPLLREVLSQEPAPGERVRRHRAIALALEEMFRDDLLPYLSVLAHHWGESAQSPEEIDKAIDYSIRAGDAAAKASALDEAVSCWENALHLNEQHRQINPQRAEILGRLGRALPVRGQRVLKILEEALAIYEKLGMTTEVADIHARLCDLLQWPFVDLPRAEEHFRKAEALLRQMPPGESLAKLYATWCDICLVRAQVPEGLDAASRAVEVAEAFNDPWLRSKVGQAMGECLFATGRLRECLQWWERAWDEADKISTGLGVTLNVCFALTNLRDYREALRWSQREMTRPRNRRSGLYEAYSGLNDQITHHAAMGELNEVRALLSKLTNPVHRGEKWLGESWLMFWAGDLESAGARWAAFVDDQRNQQRLETVCQEGFFLAQIRRWAGHWDIAEEILKEGLSYSVPGGYVPMEMLGRQALSHLYAQMGCIKEARDNLARCREIMAAGEDWRGVIGLVGLSEAAIAAAEHRFNDADSHFADALQVIRRYAVRWIEGPAVCDWGRALAGAGQRDRALEKFDQAIEFYRRVGAGQPWIDRAEVDRAKVGSDKSEGARPGQPLAEAQFRKEGDYWIVGCGDRHHKLKPAKGFVYLAQLLRSPHQEIHALVLTGAGSASGDSSEVLDSQARANYRRQISELRAELAEAERFNDLGRVAKLDGEIDDLETHLVGATGLGGRVRRSTSDAERARVAVTKRIKAAIAQIREVDDHLGRHLATSIVTGNFCCYRPDLANRIDWSL